MNLKAKMIVDTIRWSLERQGIQVYIEHKGDSDAGAIFIKHDLMNGYIELYHRVYNDNAEKKLFTIREAIDFLRARTFREGKGSKGYEIAYQNKSSRGYRFLR